MADLENGYLRLANQIRDALCIVELSGREFRVLNAIIRLTYGWSKKSDRIANSLIADKTTLKVKHVSEAVLSLAYRNIIILRRIGQTRYIGINTNWINGLIPSHIAQNVRCLFLMMKLPHGLFLYLKPRIVIPEKGKGIPENGDSYP